MLITGTSSMDKLLLTLFILNLFNIENTLATNQINNSYNYSYAFANTFAWKTFHNQTITTITNPQNPNPIQIPNLNLNHPQPPAHQHPPNPNLNLNPIVTIPQIQQIASQQPSNVIQTTKVQPIVSEYLTPPIAPQTIRTQGQVVTYSMTSNSCKDGTQRCLPTIRSTPPPLIRDYKPKNNNYIPPAVQQTNNNNNNNNNNNIRPVNDGNYIIREASNYPIENRYTNANANANNVPEHPDTAIFKRVIEGYQADQLDLLKTLIEQQIQSMKIMNNEQTKLSG